VPSVCHPYRTESVFDGGGLIHRKEVALLRICVEKDKLDILPDRCSIFAYSEGRGFSAKTAFAHASWMPASRIIMLMGEFSQEIMLSHSRSHLCHLIQTSETTEFDGRLTFKLVFNGREVLQDHAIMRPRRHAHCGTVRPECFRRHC
jgi:hypothetical protein